MLADLRESGSIEQDADVVMFIFREEYYKSREPVRGPDEADDKFDKRYHAWKEELERVHGIGEIIVAKQRHGPIGAVKLRFDAQTTKFEDFAAPDHLPIAR
jgi:replicative DNA helicase